MPKRGTSNTTHTRFYTCSLPPPKFARSRDSKSLYFGINYGTILFYMVFMSIRQIWSMVRIAATSQLWKIDCMIYIWFMTFWCLYFIIAAHYIAWFARLVDILVRIRLTFVITAFWFLVPVHRRKIRIYRCVCSSFPVWTLVKELMCSIK